jgi:hypothetical protein
MCSALVGIDPSPGPKPSRVSPSSTSPADPAAGVPTDPKKRSRQIGIGGHANSESSVTLNRNARSRSTGIRIHSHNPGPFTELDPRAIGYDPRLAADPATSVLNLKLGLIWSKLDLQLFVNNALDAHPLLQSSSDAPGSLPSYAYTLTPRTWGLLGSWSF